MAFPQDAKGHEGPERKCASFLPPHISTSCGYYLSEIGISSVKVSSVKGSKTAKERNKNSNSCLVVCGRAESDHCCCYSSSFSTSFPPPPPPRNYQLTDLWPNPSTSTITLIMIQPLNCSVLSISCPLWSPWLWISLPYDNMLSDGDTQV